MKKQPSIKKSASVSRKPPAKVKPPARPRAKRTKKKEEEEVMPIYKWVDKNTNNVIEVQRSVKEMETPPDKDECIDIMDIEDFAHADWERIITHVAFIGEKGKGRW